LEDEDEQWPAPIDNTTLKVGVIEIVVGWIVVGWIELQIRKPHSMAWNLPFCSRVL